MVDVTNLMAHMSKMISCSMPPRRHVDVFTISHVRAATRVRNIATCLWGPDFKNLMDNNIPYLAEDAEDLWEYYTALNLPPRMYPCLFFVTFSELLNEASTRFRQQHPWFDWAFKVYRVSEIITFIFPRHFFFYVHKVCWDYETRLARSSAREPQMPLLLAKGTRSQVSDWISWCCSSFLQQPVAQQSPQRTYRVPLYLVSAGLCTLAVWVGWSTWHRSADVQGYAPQNRPSTHVPPPEGYVVYMDRAPQR